MAQYQYQLRVQAQRQRMIAQQQFARIQGLNTNSVAISGGVGDLEFNPIQSGDGFLQRLIPDEVEIVPLEYIAGILVLYILAIGPGEYFLLSLFRLRRFTWITFPLLTVGFTLFTVWLSNDYLSSSVERTHATVIDVGEDGTALRENRFELLYTASTHDVITDIDRGLFTPIEYSRFRQGSIDNGYGVQIPPGAMYRGNMPPGGIRGEQSPNVLSLGLPSIEGKPPGIHQAVQNVPQWTPQINRIFRINPNDELIAAQLGKFDWNRDWDLRRDGREISQQAIKAFGPQTKVIGFIGHEVLLGDPGKFFVPASSMRGQMSIEMQMEMPRTRDFLTDICVRTPGKLFEVVSQIAPHGGDNFEDITLLDVTDDSQSLLIIVVPDENGLRIYRRLYRNGAGKSSTTKVLAKLMRNFEGSARVCGFDVRRDPTAVRERMGYVPDFFGVYEDLTAREYLHFFAAAYRIGRKTRDGIVDDVLELTDLTNKIDAQVDTLSRGMKQRLSLARVLLHDPELLLLDEPTSGLDPRARIEVRELLKALTEMGKTILIPSHILHELAHLCTRIGIIEAGEMVAQGSLNDIYRQLSLLRVVHLQLADPTPELLEKIRTTPGVEELEEQVDRIALRLREDMTSIEDFHQALVEHGAKIRMFQPEAMDMETAFMKLTLGKTA